jgi:hypothetical protein
VRKARKVLLALKGRKDPRGPKARKVQKAALAARAGLALKDLRGPGLVLLGRLGRQGPRALRERLGPKEKALRVLLGRPGRLGLPVGRRERQDQLGRLGRPARQDRKAPRVVLAGRALKVRQDQGAARQALLVPRDPRVAQEGRAEQDRRGR